METNSSFKKNTIFVSIASFRDKELIKTVKSCITNAKNPENINIGICWQYDEEENINALDEYKNIKTEKIYWKDVKGSVCWARHLIQTKLYKNEDWYLQIDSHTRFVKNWDEILINMYNELDYEKSIITIVPPHYYDDSAEASLPPFADEKVELVDGIYFDTTVKKQKLDSISDSGFTSFGFTTAEDISKPILARHISGALLFTHGEWVNKVPYDPELYFTGEENALTIRSYTNGYNIYNPNKIICWHLKYLFPNRKRHWNTFETSITQKFESNSYQRYKNIVCSENGGKEYGIYGIGNERSIEEWEIYSGISYVKKLAHPDAYKGITPNPNTISNIEEWNNLKQSK